MKIDISSKQNLVSESASKKQQENAKILFGKKGAGILSKLEEFSKEKQLRTNGIDILISALKTKDTAALEKYAASATGKKMVANVKKLASAKSFSAIMSNIKSIKPNSALQKLSGSTPTPSMRTQKTKGKGLPKSGISVSSTYSSTVPSKVLNMVDSLITPRLAKQIIKVAEPGEGVSVKGLSYAKIKKLIDALPTPMKKEDVLPSWVSAEEEGSVTALNVRGDNGEILGYYSPQSRSAEFRISVLKEGFKESCIVSIQV